MELVLINIGKTQSKWIETGIKDYIERINHYIKFSNINIPDLKKGNLTREVQKDLEGRKIIENLSKTDFLVLLDERGKTIDTMELSRWIEKKMLSGLKRLVFVIGGPFGFSKELYNRADFMLSLSLLTFTHEMAKLFFIEQCYRCFTIIKGESYHHQ